MRAAVSKAVSVLLFVIFHIKADDANTPYRIMKAGKLREYIRYIDDTEPLTNIMLTAVYKKLGAKVLYRNITFRNRQGGVNTIDPGQIFDMGTASVKRMRTLAERLDRR